MSFSIVFDLNNVDRFALFVSKPSRNETKSSIMLDSLLLAG